MKEPPLWWLHPSLDYEGWEETLTLLNLLTYLCKAYADAVAVHAAPGPGVHNLDQGADEEDIWAQASRVSSPKSGKHLLYCHGCSWDCSHVWMPSEGSRHTSVSQASLDIAGCCIVHLQYAYDLWLLLHRLGGTLRQCRNILSHHVGQGQRRPFKGITGAAQGVVPMDTPEMQAPTPSYGANPYFGRDIESQKTPPNISGPESLLGYTFRRQRAINWYGYPLLALAYRDSTHDIPYIKRWLWDVESAVNVFLLSPQYGTLMLTWNRWWNIANKNFLELEWSLIDISNNNFEAPFASTITRLAFHRGINRCIQPYSENIKHAVGVIGMRTSIFWYLEKYQSGLCTQGWLGSESILRWRLSILPLCAYLKNFESGGIHMVRHCPAGRGVHGSHNRRHLWHQPSV